MATLDSPLRGVLGKTAKLVESALGIRTVGELLAHYPRRYAERGELTPLSGLRVGEHVTVLAEVSAVTLRPLRNRPGHVLDVVVTDGSGSVVLTFFNQTWRRRDLVAGRRGLFAGRVEVFNRTRRLTHPDYVLLDGGSGSRPDAVDPGEFAGALIPVYPATAALSSWTIARSVRVALDVLDDPPDPIPPDVRAEHLLLDLGSALRAVHRPRDRAELSRGVERLKWDEALVVQVALAQRRRLAAAIPTTPRAGRPGGLLDAFDARLPFALTAGQREVGAVLAAELARARPMHRLLHGEVGSGKTVVALRAMLAVVDSGGQAALLAPTEVLAAQHELSIRALLGPLGVAGELGAAEQATRVVLLTGSQSAASRRRALGEVDDGTAGIVVGTHALLHEGVRFADLGLVVIDEQHRFGVEQRDALRAKGAEPPHLLVMTATPIPRTVAMTVYGDLETCTLTELPAGRPDVRTYLVPADQPSWLDRMWGRVRDEVAAGHQAYVVCPRIGGDVPPGAPPDSSSVGSGDEAADLDPDDSPGRRPAAAVLDWAPRLAAGELAGLRVAVLHGRLPAEEKDAVMRAYAAGRIDVLVATTVVEVGVDVANATVMVVIDADRFGVSQLHQLRGRIGRGTAAGWCLLHTEAPSDTPARRRLQGVAATRDGFALARLDLEARREGNVLGVEQSGRRSALRLLSLLRDEELILAARRVAARLVEADPELVGNPALAAAARTLLADERADYLQKA